MADVLSLGMTVRQTAAAPAVADAAAAPAAATTIAPTGGAATNAAGSVAAAGLKAAPDLFHEVLSDLNPLQYIPVVGTIYRAITGDMGSPALRFVASLGTSFAIGGPIGIAITAGEKLVGIDPERMVLDAARQLFHLGHADAASPAPGAGAKPQPAGPAAPQLAFAVGSRSVSADDLNMMELQRLNG